jgi:hypothetical protein
MLSVIYAECHYAECRSAERFSTYGADLIFLSQDDRKKIHELSFGDFLVI